VSTTSLERPLVQPAFTPISGTRKARSSLAGVLVTAAFLVAVLPLLWVLYTVVQRGYKAVIVSNWWSHSQRGILPDDFGGGIYHALYGTIVQGLIASVVSVPLGILVAIYLVEYGRGGLAKTTTFMVDVLSGIPSIVAALFVFSVWITTFGFSQSAFAVSLALILLMLPVVIARRRRCCGWSQTSCGRPRTRWECPGPGRSCGWCCPARCPASSAASCSRWRG